jgi:hypothetical protein
VRGHAGCRTRELVLTHTPELHDVGPTEQTLAISHQLQQTTTSPLVPAAVPLQ